MEDIMGLQQGIKNHEDNSLTLSFIIRKLGMNCKNCNTTDFVGTIFYPNLCIPCIIKLGKK